MAVFGLYAVFAERFRMGLGVTRDAEEVLRMGERRERRWFPRGYFLFTTKPAAMTQRAATMTPAAMPADSFEDGEFTGGIGAGPE
jgi:hypothetical protein